MTPQRPAQGSPLGHASKPSDRYDPTLLFPIPRAEQRGQLGLAAGAPLPFFGADLWTRVRTVLAESARQADARDCEFDGAV